MERMLRVNNLLKRELGVIFEREICTELSCLVTVTDVVCAPDLRSARVHVSAYGPEDQKQRVLGVLRRHRKGIQHEIARAVKLKYTPRLQFCLDDTAEKADRIMQLLDELSDGRTDETA